jgi:copper(I)-binding protein
MLIARLSGVADMIPRMHRRLFVSLAAALTLGVPAAHAHEYSLGPLLIEHPWTRPTVPGQGTGGGYLGLHNRGSAADRLLGASSSAASRVEVHEMRMEGDVMRMREIGTLALPAGGRIKLEPGGLHLMLFGLKAPLKLGDKLPLTLRFEKAGRVDVMLHVESGPAAAPADHKH